MADGIKPLNNMMPVRQIQTKDQADQKLHDVAKLYEKQFLREMMKNMRATVHDAGLTQVDQGRTIFQEKLDDEYVEKWGDKGGIGLSDLIYNQLVDRYGEQMGIKSGELRPVGPIKITSQSEFRPNFPQQVKTQELTNKINQNLNMRFDRIFNKEQEPKEIYSPWSGALLGQRRLDDQNVVDIEHDNGRVSQMIFKGYLKPMEQGQRLERGENIGLLSPEASSFFWNLK